QVANWHIHLENSSKALSNAHFVVNVDAQAPQLFTLLPSETQDVVAHAPDGLPSHALITADGTTLIDQTTTKTCNVPKAWAYFNCGAYGGGFYPHANYAMGNNSDVPAHFEIHEANGTVIKETHFGLLNTTIGYGEKLTEGEHYDGYVTID